MLATILRGAPSTVEVGGAPVRIRDGFRTGLLVETLDLADPWCRSRALWQWFSGPSRGGVPDAVSADPQGAFEAGLAWHGGAWGSVRYGRPQARQRARRVFAWNADAGIVVADFQRLYGIDLTDPATQVHWWRFAALFQAAVRTAGSLLGDAVDARGSAPRGADPSAWARRASAWALPPTEAEMMEAARLEF